MLSALKSLYRLFIPAVCPVCGAVLSADSSEVCMECMMHLPYTHLWAASQNAMEQRLSGNIPVVRAAALFWFREQSKWRSVIHDFKYHNQWYIAGQMGRLCAQRFQESGFFDDVDLIIPVPLHPWRRLLRGYNQSEYIAAAISRQTKIPYCFNAVRRCKNNPPQVSQNYSSRWTNIEDIFAVSRPELLEGKHIVIVDDVFTTGATIITLAKIILKACGGNVRISVATLAVSQRISEAQ